MIKNTYTTLANAIRALSMDAVQKANSGHPGMPMGMADIATVLWKEFLNHNPQNPNWINRDRFIISNGHGAMLHYSLLHLTGYDLSIEDIKQFRQLHSKTPGHPEHAETPGIETTTGPLGQGLANAVGMAIAEKMIAAQFNRDHFPIVDHYTYAFVGDGCLMEGISHEVCSLAGTLGLGKLIVFYDDNSISIDGKVEGWFKDNTVERFHAYHWHVVANVNGHDPDAIREAIEAAQAVTDKPSLICCKTIIGYGAPTLAGSEKVHGAPLGEKEILGAREKLQWNHAPFEIPADIYQDWNAKAEGETAEKEWNALFETYQNQFPDLANEFTRRAQKKLPKNWHALIETLCKNFITQAENIASRKASQLCLAHLVKGLPELVGGSADLTHSNLTYVADSKAITRQDFSGNYIYYGVREFGMSAIMNGIALYGELIPYGGTFLTFSDYARNAVRMAALMKQRVIFVYTHDSIGLGEDGPTHQAVEHAAMLRLTPNVFVWRPCDTLETAIAWQKAIEKTDAPSALLLSRQNLPFMPYFEGRTELIAKGGYILAESENPEYILIATGSEVSIAYEAFLELKKQNVRVRLVSMPCTTLFDQQPEDYKNNVLPKHIKKRFAIEAAAQDFWYKYVGLDGNIIGLNRFGASAPYQDVYNECGITADHLVKQIMR